MFSCSEGSQLVSLAVADWGLRACIYKRCFRHICPFPRPLPSHCERATHQPLSILLYPSSYTMSHVPTGQLPRSAPGAGAPPSGMGKVRLPLFSCDACSSVVPQAFVVGGSAVALLLGSWIYSQHHVQKRNGTRNTRESHVHLRRALPLSFLASCIPPCGRLCSPSAPMM